MTAKKAPKAKAVKTAAPRRPRVQYSAELAERVLDLWIDGVTLKEIERKGRGMPSRRDVYRWQDECPEFAMEFKRARKARAASALDDGERPIT